VLINSSKKLVRAKVAKLFSHKKTPVGAGVLLFSNSES